VLSLRLDEKGRRDASGFAAFFILLSHRLSLRHGRVAVAEQPINRLGADRRRAVGDLVRRGPLHNEASHQLRPHHSRVAFVGCDLLGGFNSFGLGD